MSRARRLAGSVVLALVICGLATAVLALGEIALRGRVR